MKRRNWLRTTIAMLTLIATVLETGFTPVSTLAAEFTNEDGIVVNNDAIEEAEQSSNDGELQMEVTRDSEEPAAEEAAPEEQPEENADLAESSQESNVVEGDTLEETQDGETSEEAADGEVIDGEVIDGEATEGNVVDGEEIVEETGNTEAAEEEVFEEAEELKKEGTLSVTDSGISGSGYDESSIYVNTDDLANKDKFRVEFTGPASASYNPVLNDELDKTNGGRYDFEGLEGGDFTVRATSSDDVILSYRYNEDGYPEIVVESKPVEKILETKTLTSVDDAEIQAITGEGFERVTVNFNTEELSEKAAFKLIVESDADATVDGYDAKSGITGLDKNTGSLTIEGLEEESFTAYVISDNDEVQIKTIAEINSVEDGEATFTVDTVDTKRVYEYEDDKVKVTATLEKADAVPDDAYFGVQLLSEQETEDYLDVLNRDKGEDEVPATIENILLYDIGFYTDDSKSEEIEPEEGSVKVSIEFKKEQLSEEIGAMEPEEVTVTHIIEDGADVTTEKVEADTSVDDQTIEFTTESFSKYAIEADGKLFFEPGTKMDFKDALGANVNYGQVANSIVISGDMETNLATSLLKLDGNAKSIKSSRNNGGGTGYTFVADAEGGTGFYMMNNSNQGNNVIYVGKDSNAVAHFDMQEMDNKGTRVDQTSFSKQDITDKVEALIETAKTNSGNIATENGAYNFADFSSKAGGYGSYTIDISNNPSADPEGNGTYYFNLTKAEYDAIGGDVSNFVFVKKPDQNVVITITGSPITLRRNIGFKMAGSNETIGADGTKVAMNEHLIINLPDATSVNFSGSVDAAVLCPNADLKIDDVSSGWVVAKDISKNGSVEFHNTWHDMPITETEEKDYEFKVTKAFNAPTGVNWPSDGFTFTLEPYSSSNDKGNTWNPDPPMPDDQEKVEITINQGSDPASNTGSFGKISFDALTIYNEGKELGQVSDHFAGVTGVVDKYYMVYMYTIKEKIPEGAQPYADENGKIEKFHDHIENVDSVKYYIKDDVIYDAEPWTLKLWVNAAKIKYGNTESYILSFSSGDCHTKQARASSCDPENTNPITFTNKYENKPISEPLVIEGEKLVNGSSVNVESGKFKFNLYTYQKDNKWNDPQAGFANVTNEGNHFEFPEIELKFSQATSCYDAEGNQLTDKKEFESKGKTACFYFKIDESSDCAPYAFDKAVYVVKVKLTRNGTGFDKEIKYFRFADPKNVNCKTNPQTDTVDEANGITLADSISFNNTYTATGSTTLYGHKILENREFKQGDTFTFTLTPKTEGDKNVGQSITITPIEGNEYDFQFAPLNYKYADAGHKYVYTIAETKGNISGITYSTQTYDVEVTVTDNGNGTLTATPDKATQANRASFTNTYAADGKVVFQATKNYRTGSALAATKSFSFVLKDVTDPSNPVILGTEEVIGERTATFAEISYNDTTKAGTYHYTINEVLPQGATAENNYTVDGIIYDHRTYNIEVVVADNKAGQLVPTVTGSFDNGDTAENVKNPVFINDYRVDEVTAPIGGTKELHGKNLERGEFTFTIDADGKTTSDAVEAGKVVLPNPSSVQNGVPETLEVNKFRFGDITFKAAGTYKFVVKEQKGTDATVEYSSQEYHVTFVVVDNGNGQLAVESRDVSDDAIIFINTKNGAGEVPLFAKKVLTGKKLEKDQFSFELKDVDGNVIETKKNDASGSVSFTPIKYENNSNGLALVNPGDKAEYKYSINEVVPDPKAAGYSYDEHSETVTVTVTLQADGTLKAEADNATLVKPATFNNRYEAKGSVQFEGTKKITGREFTDDDEGKFVAELYDASGSLVDKVDIKKDTKIWGENGGEFKFKTLNFTQEDLKVASDGGYEKSITKKYTVKETGSAAGIQMDQSIYDVKVTITDNGNGTLNVQKQYSLNGNDLDAITFVNKFTTSGQTNFVAKKAVTGAVLEGEQFSFELKDANGKVIDTKKNGDGGEITFKTLNYDQDDVANSPITYTISEVIKDKAGYTLDSKVYTAKAFLTLNTDGTLTVTPKYYDGSTEVAEASVIFNNTYTAKGSEQPYVFKKLTGRDLDDLNAFTFELYDEAGGLVSKATNVAAKAGMPAKATFPVIEFTQADLNDIASHKVDKNTYAKYYTVKELIPEGATTDNNYTVGGYKYDPTVYNLVITLEDEGNGNIKTDWYAYKTGTVPEKPSLWDKVVEFLTSKSASKNAVFNNEYAAEGALDLTAKKTLTGKELKADDFGFTLSGKTEDGVNYTDTKTNDANGNVKFNRIKYTKAGEYEYTIKEDIPNNAQVEGDYYVLNGVKYDNTEHKINVTVTDPGNGKLTVTATITGESPVTSAEVTDETTGKVVNLCKPAPVGFTNTYDCKPVSITLGGTKTLVGRDLANENEFSFNMKSAEGNPKDFDQTVKINKGVNGRFGAFGFDEISFTFDDMKNSDNKTYATDRLFEYVISEVVPDDDNKLKGITYDGNSYKVVISVHNENGKLTAKVTSNDAEVTDTSKAASFTNKYDAEDSLSLPVKKLVEGTTDTSKVFTFELTGDVPNPLITTATKNQTSYFAPIKYTLEQIKNTDGTYNRTYNYTVSEVKRSEGEPYPGYTYSEEVYKVKVVVTSDGKSGKIDKDVTITKNTAAYDKAEMEFTNTYVAEGNTTIEGTKDLVGRELKDGEFEFALSQKEGEGENAEYSQIAKTSNKAGKFSFDLKYTQDDIGNTYYYTVNEIIPDDASEGTIDYDGSVYDITVSVTDNKDGTLQINKDIKKGTATETVCAFTNKEINPGEVVFEAKKTLNGKALDNDMFAFTLTGDGQDQRVLNKGENVTFDKISYSYKDIGKTFTYTIKEEGKSGDGITYDATQYIATVEVKGFDDDRNLILEKTIKKNNDIVQEITFDNTYESITKVQLGGHKHLAGFVDGKTPLGTYSFELLDSNGKRVQVDTSVKDKSNIVSDGGEEQIKTVTPKNATDPTDYSFDELIFDQDDYLNSAATDHTFVYTVKEVIPQQKEANVTYAENTYTVTIKLYYDADGLLQATKSTKEGVALDKLDFTNKYEAEGDIILDGIKTITGKDLEDGAYTFTLKGEGQDQEVTRSTTNASNTFTFEAIHYEAKDIGEHYYTITEEAKTKDGSTYDASVYRVQVLVDQGKDGKLEVKKGEVTKDGNVIGATDPIQFNNTYAAYGEHALKVKKIMHNKPLLKGLFTFVLKDENGKELERVSNEAVPLKSVEDLTAEYEFEFTKGLQFTHEDLKGPDKKSYLPEIRKYYTVEELNESKKGYIYDRTVYIVELTIKPTDKLITEGEHKGEYELEITEKIVKKNGGSIGSSGEKNFLQRLFDGLIGDSNSAADKGIVFENDYNASCIADPPILTKEIMGREVERGEFKFKIDNDDGLESMGEYVKGYHRNVANGYTCTGKETKHPGEISVDDLKFFYTDLLKFVTDGSKTDNEATINLETGEVRKTFVYYAEEDKDVTQEGVENSQARFKLAFTVIDEGTGELRTEPAIEDMKWEQISENALSKEAAESIFLNKYNMTGSATIKGNKKLEGRALTADDVFEFIITDDKTGETATVYNTVDEYGIPSKVEFNGENVPFLNYREGYFEDPENPGTLMEVHEAGDYTYTIEEKQGNKSGVTYDTATYKVTVRVTKEASKIAKGFLKAEVINSEKIISTNNKERFGISSGDAFEFKNEFKATGDLKIDGTKLLVDENGNNIGSTQSLEGQYEFALYNYETEDLRARANTKGLLVDIARTAANGDFSLTVPKGYSQLDLREKNGEYVTEKTLYYKIVETKPSNGTMVGTLFESDGVIYDNTEYFVDVTLKNNGTDKLEVTKTITNATTGEQVTDVSYTNIYKNFVSIDGQKYWVDKETDPSKRPDVILNLYSSAVDNGRTIINTYTLKAPELRYRFTTDAAGKKLPATDSSGRTITYRVEELPIRGYLSEQKGYDFYNTSGDILIRKIDAQTGTALSGATLAIYDGSTEIERWVSGESAHVVEKELTKGKTYTLREISAPEGYEVAAEQTFTVPTDGSDITVTMADPPIIGSVRLTKRDATTREALAGAEFALYTDAGARIYATGTAGSYRATNLTSNGVFVTDATGNLTITDLPYGTYYFVETKAPDGYALSAERLGFTILRSGELVEVTYLNEKALGSVRLRKANEDGSRTLAGAVFELYSATPRTVGQAATATIFTDAYFRYGTYRTNSDGEIYVGDLPWDDYFFVEVDAPTGYEVNRDVNGDDLVYTFSIDRFTANSVIDVGYVYNRPTTPPPPPTTPTPPPTTTTTTPPPTTITTTPPPTTTTTPSGVLGERVERIEKGGVVNGVLGVRAKPTSGVLGVRSGPVTGDASNIILWLLLLCACVATIVATIVTGKKKKTGANK